MGKIGGKEARRKGGLANTVAQQEDRRRGASGSPGSHAGEEEGGRRGVC